MLDRDNHKCQTCLSVEDLEVHHKTYERLGDELPEDLITLCRECHHAITEVIRRRRYKNRQVAIQDYEPKTPQIIIEARSHEPAIIEVSDHIRVSPAAPQWTDSRSPKSLLQDDEGDQQQTRKDGRRF